ncbi:MAG TPA: MbtH family NRPS accessory protein [Longimicrobium sp.]|nr:MbtH family NRPS accessory protein [Longimicrobium sp.]
MPTDVKEDTRTCIVLVNHEEQCSLWLADKEIPPGWSAVGKPGSREECLAYVEEVWTDMTPKSLRKQTQEA